MKKIKYEEYSKWDKFESNDSTAYILQGTEAHFNTLYIDSKRTIIKDKELDIEIDLSHKIKQIDVIIIDGIAFIKGEL